METANPGQIPFNLDEVPTFVSADVANAAHQHLDAKILRLERSIRALKSRRNNFALVSNIPPEVLLEIFFFCSAQAALESSGEWIAVTRVCRQWRNVALGCSRLWSLIVPISPKWTEEMIARSKNARITIVHSSTGYSNAARRSIKMALETYTRKIYALHMEARASWLRGVFDHLDAPMLHLKSLHLEATDVKGGPDYKIPETFCAAISPMLRKLSLVSCIPPWKACFLTNLRVLRLESMSRALRVPDILGILGRTPLLTTFELRYDYLHDFFPEAKHSLEEVNLPNLTSIYISSDIHECGILLKYMSFPAATTITLVCDITWNVKTHLSSPIPALSDFCARLQSLDIRMVSADRNIEIRGWHASDVDPHDTQALAAPNLRITLNRRNPFAAARRDELAMEICKALSFTQLRTLAVADVDGMTRRAWRAIFGQCALVRKATVSDCTVAASGLIDALAPVKSKRAGRKGANVFLPALKDLEFAWLDFDEDDPEAVDFDDLCGCLQARARLDRITIKECTHFAEVEFLELEELVDEVDWDGVVGDGTSEEYESGDSELSDYLYLRDDFEEEDDSGSEAY
ncbi:hypothetical protein PLICRDRAFT_254111 [Plicaturopsis crispa FD-325 SS-3]|nr:hypothetical protein PLICRDRAFT_254111 [Plicaturopsis crispa FD-325 SS-3]